VKPKEPRKGRGAVSNLQGRFETLKREEFDDGWGATEQSVGALDASAPGAGPDAPRGAPDTTEFIAPDPFEPDVLPPLRTTVTRETAKSILTRNDSPDIPFRVSINPYRGCEHGCIYCFARPTHSYLGLSPGLDFESKLFAKVNAPQLLRAALCAKNYQPEVIALGVNTDAYQPVERELGITRGLLEVLAETRHPVALITKSALIERDLDLLAPMAARALVAATVTITTLDHSLARSLEPRAASPTRRLRTIRTLAEAGVPVWLSVSPLIPFVNDHELEHILEAAAEAGARGAHYIVMRLPWELNEVFQQWLQAHFPLRAERVMNRIRDLRGGKDYDSSFGKRMSGEGIWADLLRQRFAAACTRVGMSIERGNTLRLDTSQFVRPAPPAMPPVPKAGDRGQFDLFG